MVVESLCVPDESIEPVLPVDSPAWCFLLFFECFLVVVVVVDVSSFDEPVEPVALVLSLELPIPLEDGLVLVEDGFMPVPVDDGLVVSVEDGLAPVEEGEEEEPLDVPVPEVESDVPEVLPEPVAPVLLGLEPLRSSDPAEDPVPEEPADDPVPELEPPIAPDEVMSRLFTLRASPEPE